MGVYFYRDFVLQAVSSNSFRQYRLAMEHTSTECVKLIVKDVANRGLRVWI